MCLLLSKHIKQQQISDKKTSHIFVTDKTNCPIRTTTSKELWDRMTSANYLATWTGRIVWQALSALSGIAILYAIGASRDSLFGRSFSNDSLLDDLNNSVQDSLFKMF